MNRKNLDPLNILWILLFLTGFFVACVRLIFLNEDALSKVLNSTFESSKIAFEISIGLTGVLCFWMGLMKVGEEAGFIKILTRVLGPLFKKIMPGVPKDHPALGSITMNMAANMLGLDNAATPAGLKAMKELQELNPKKDIASNDQIMFLVINAASVTIIPTTIFAYRAQAGAASPTDVFIPMLVTSFASTLSGFLLVAWIQKINVFNRTIFAYLGTMTALIAGLVYYFMQLTSEEVQRQSSILSSFMILSIISTFVVMALIKKINVYSSFIEGAKEGFGVAVTIIPYLVAMLVAIGIFRASGAMDFFMSSLRLMVEWTGLDTKFVDAMPTALLKPLSGGGARGMMLETMKTHGVDSFAGRLASIFQGSNETTFYVLAVYFGSVGIRKTRHAVLCGLTSDAIGTVVAIWMCYIFFG
jgi:spore maturation protein SpmA